MEAGAIVTSLLRLRETLQSQLQDDRQRFECNPEMYFRLAAFAFTKHDGDVDEPVSGAPSPEIHFDLKAVAVRLGFNRLEAAQHFCPPTFEAAGAIGERQSGDDSGVDRAQSAQ